MNTLTENEKSGLQIMQKVSRQRLWQIRKKAESKCIICGKERHPGNANHCSDHRQKVTNRTRSRRGTFPVTLWSNALDAFLNPVSDEES